MTHVVIEALGTLQSGKIIGVALVPTFSLNNNGYIPEVAEMNGNRCVPIDWNHDQRENAGNVCFTYNKETRELLYEGTVTDPFILSEIRKYKEAKQQMHVSIEANVTEAQEVCSRKTCYNIAVAMEITRMAITPTPGVSSTTLKLIESAPDHQIVKFETDFGELARVNQELEDLKGRVEKIEAHLTRPIVNPTDIPKDGLIEKCPDCGK